MFSRLSRTRTSRGVRRDQLVRNLSFSFHRHSATFVKVRDHPGVFLYILQHLPELIEKVRSCESKVATYLLKKNSAMVSNLDEAKRRSRWELQKICCACSLQPVCQCCVHLRYSHCGSALGKNQHQIDRFSKNRFDRSSRVSLRFCEISINR